jgi:Single-stranded DNA binding protein Ssb-like, OB fold
METLRHKSVPEGEYLAVLSAKHSVDPDRLFQALVSTKEKQKNMCGSLSIECRGRIGDRRIFLMKEDSKVVAQVRLGEVFLSEKINPISKFMNSERIRRYLAKKNVSVFRLSAISDLHVGMKRINLTARVMEVCEPHSIITRHGNPGVLADALIGDSSGTVKLVLWGEQIGSVSVGDIVRIVNARVLSFRGEKQVQVGRSGTIRVERERPIPD